MKRTRISSSIIGSMQMDVFNLIGGDVSTSSDESDNDQDHSSSEDDVEENFADGKKKGRKGLSKRVGVSQKMSISKLAKIAKTASGERKRMAQWNLNMKRGRKKKK